MGKKRKNEKSLHEVFDYDGSSYMPVLRGDNDCTACAFYDFCDETVIKKTIGSCVDKQRSDNKNIIIQEV